MTRTLFESLMEEFHVFPKFREFVLLFGAKHGEREIGPPQMRFRWLPTGMEKGIRPCWTGFGIQSCLLLGMIADSCRICIWAEIR